MARRAAARASSRFAEARYQRSGISGKGSIVAVTIVEIARKLDLSHSTVSRVLNNRDSELISADTRERVLTTARQLGYVPNMAARSLRESKTNTVGLFGSAFIGNWSGVNRGIVHGIAQAMRGSGLDVFFALTSDEGDHVLARPAWRWDGALVLPAPSGITLELLTTADQPTVCVNDALDRFPSVICDYAQGTWLALDHLWQHGHRRIAYAAGEQWTPAHGSLGARQASYLSFAEHQRMAPVPGYEPVPSGTDRAPWLREAVEQHGATAVACYDHAVAIDVMGAAHRLGLRVPDDLSLIGFSDEFPASRLEPPLTMVAQRSELMGRLAANWLKTRMGLSVDEQGQAELAGWPVHEPTAEASHGPLRLIAEILIERRSVAPPRRTPAALSI